MKRIKLEYWSFFVVFAVLTILCILLSQENWASIMLSGVALMVSTLAMGLSDPKKNDFDGEIRAWSQNPKGKSEDAEKWFKVVMQIHNNSNEVIDDFVYRLRIPRYKARTGEKNRHRIDITHGESLVLIDKSFVFLGPKSSGQFIPIDFEMKLEDWNKQYIEITVSGTHINPKTFVIKPDESKSLIDATNNEYKIIK
jgi:hypothetical protein